MKKLTSFLAAILSFVVCLGGVSPALAQELPQPASRGITTFYATENEQKAGVRFYENMGYVIAIPNDQISGLPQKVGEFEKFFRPILENGRTQNGTNGSFTEGGFDFRASIPVTSGTDERFDVIAPRDNRIYSVVAGLPASLCPLKIDTTEVDFFLNVEEAKTRAGELDNKGFLVYVSPKDDLTIKAFSKLFYDESGNLKTDNNCFLVSGASQKIQTDFRKISHLLPPSLQQQARQKPFTYLPKSGEFIYLVNARKTIQGGNDVEMRGRVDDKNDFYLVDTNNPINLDGSLREWSIWAKNTSPVQLIIYRLELGMATFGNKAPWSVVAKSKVETPVVGDNSFKLPAPIEVLKGDFVGLYHPNQGSVAFTQDRPDNMNIPNLTGSVLQTSDGSGPNSATNFVFSSDRTYSVSVR
ncbi:MULTISPECIES: hypothetical protein [unclassified Microcoleus]|uniref:hypothetical protein n=1 Tax=unclassified Microcoleus TaxID=2642155 RepID=UPI001DA40DB5|nr:MULTISPECIES: hypothetical protein [unclassified Microcoleus]MCC3475850.1 hypothetical protein [Microcoleus sp. PH2017_13_LAR_U_A]MCC3488372.1 hypothetical protein [Microcoleus sp. PH2017_14_LAR_D_A]MCC3593485.1 hypothetical protein [Microcoleus sp. PH2017_28_MFU_U_A]MCC3600940.1 hypothetical protein [Microcoleus sp. PH2017_26_ELK_O_A]MCC3626117.1 hypothetical protein [Microcoleus sp. PH2017_36_ELK_O_B]